MNFRVFVIAIASAAVLTACARPAVNLEAEGEALKQVSRDWSAKVATGDLDAILAGWAALVAKTRRGSCLSSPKRAAGGGEASGVLVSPPGQRSLPSG